MFATRVDMIGSTRTCRDGPTPSGARHHKSGPLTIRPQASGWGEKKKKQDFRLSLVSQETKVLSFYRLPPLLSMQTAKRARLHHIGDTRKNVSATAVSASASAAAPAHHFLTHILTLATAQLTRQSGFSHARASNMHILTEVLAKCQEDTHTHTHTRTAMENIDHSAVPV
jgi:hypothetical protein